MMFTSFVTWLLLGEMSCFAHMSAWFVSGVLVLAPRGVWCPLAYPKIAMASELKPLGKPKKNDEFNREVLTPRLPSQNPPRASFSLQAFGFAELHRARKPLAHIAGGDPRHTSPVIVGDIR